MSAWMKWPCGPGRSGCTAVIHPDGAPLGLPITCGWFADGGPHPDPERGYREPLCREHKEKAIAALVALEREG